VTLALMPLVDGAPVKRAVFDLRIDTIDAQGNATPHLVVTDLATGPEGELTWIGTCASGPNGEPGLGVATATLKEIELADGVTTFGSQLPMTQLRPFLCRQGGDTPIDFAFEIVLQLDRGFTDVRISVEALECAAKFDCVDSLLPDAAGVHGPTFVSGLTCSGAGTGAVPLDNLLSFTRELNCYDARGLRLPRTVAPLISNTRTYTGLLLPPTAGGTGAAYWNTATLLDRAAIGNADHCRFEGLAFVRSQPVGGPRLGWVRSESAAIRWDVEVRLVDDKLACEGSIGPTRVGLRIDEAPSPADSRYPATEAPVTQTTMAIVAGLRDVGCAALGATWQGAVEARNEAAAAVAQDQYQSELVAALTNMQTRLGEPPDTAAPNSFLGALAQAEALHRMVGFDPTAIDAPLAIAAGALAEAESALSPYQDVTGVVAVSAQLAAVHEPLAAVGAEAGAGAYFAFSYNAAEGFALAAAREGNALLAETRAGQGDGEALGARLAAAQAIVDRANSAYSQCLITDPGPTDALRIWGARDITFPLPADGVTNAPAQDDLLWVHNQLGAPYDVTLEAACTPEAGKALAVVALRDSSVAASVRRAVLLLLRRSTGDWVCARESDGSCIPYDLADVVCTPVAP